MPTDANVVTILHFNDVYNIEQREQEPVGGAARFVKAMNRQRHLNPLILFSGDCFNPSLNHGVENLVGLARQCNFPWLLSNVLDIDTEEPLAEGIDKKIIEWGGKKIGLMGLVEEEWIETLSTVDAEDIIFLDFVQEGRDLAKELREEGADYVIALTHMRWPNDRKLAREVKEIDLVLGGHDHSYEIEKIEGTYVIKSGTDFRDFSVITLDFSRPQVDVQVKRITIDSSIPEDPDIKRVVDGYLDQMGEKMDEVVGAIDVDLDGRFSSVRTQETNLGNFVTDIMLHATHADVAMLNSGTLRSDRVLPRGPVLFRDLLCILPLLDALVVLKVTGDQLLRALENGVSQYPAHEGRFPQVAGMRFAFDPAEPSGSRVPAASVYVQGELLDKQRTYLLATKHYMSTGHDGYHMLEDAEVIVGAEIAPGLITIIQNHFNACDVVRKGSTTLHKQSIIPVTTRRSLSQQLSVHEAPDVEVHVAGAQSQPSSQSLTTPASRRAGLLSAARVVGRLARKRSIQSLEKQCVAATLAPQVEGRITVINSETRRELDSAFNALTVSIQAIAEEKD